MSNRTGSLDLIKRINRSLVLEIIREEQPISRALIAKKLGLSRSTVTSVVNDLLQKKFVVELGLGDSSKGGGRRGIELGFNPKSGYGIGVDIGRTRTLLVFSDLSGEIAYRQEAKTNDSIESTIDFIKEGIEKSGIDESLILGMGIGLPGIVNSRTGVVLDVPMQDWVGVNLLERTRKPFKFPVYVNNDVNCAAMGERWLSRDGWSDDLFFIAIGTGVGSAIIANGELVEGHHFSAGEINCFVDREDLRLGRSVQSEGSGPFERQISGTALAGTGLSPEELFAKYRSGDAEAKSVIEAFVTYLSVTIANVASLLNPEHVVIGGGVSGSMDTVIDTIRQQVAELTPIRTNIRLAIQGKDAGALGAASYVFQQLQNAEEL